MQHLVMKLSEKLDDVDRDGRKDPFLIQIHAHTCIAQKNVNLLASQTKNEAL